MYARHKALALARATLLALAALFTAAAGATPGRAAQTEQTEQTEQTAPPRKPQGPVAGPAIKLPRGEGATDVRAQTTGAKEGEPVRGASAPQKWEYCVIRGFSYRQKGFSISSEHMPAASVRYFPNGSEEVEGATEEEALGNAFAKLGDEGWELAGVRTDFNLSDGNGRSSTVYFFKRPKRQE